MMDDLPTAFAVWAAVVGMIGLAIVWELSRLRTELRELRMDFHKELKDVRIDFMRATIHAEGRTTHIESHLQATDDGFKPWRSSE